MAEYNAGRGTTALGIVGTVLGSLGTAGALGNGVSILGGNNQRAPYYEAQCACQADIHSVKDLMAKDAEIAELKSEKYADKNGLELYKYIDGELKDIRKDIEVNKDNANAQFAQQAVYNATANGTMSTIAGQIAGLQTVVNQITQVAVPTSALCTFGCGCNKCNTCGNI